jgi:hypothetical protein
MPFAHDIYAQTPELNITKGDERLERNLRTHISMPALSCTRRGSKQAMKNQKRISAPAAWKWVFLSKV